MRYTNAAEVLPQNLLLELQKYADGKVLYIPKLETKKPWGEDSGSKMYYAKRNLDMKAKYQNGNSIEDISQEYGLAFDTVKKIIYS